ncbi:MAG: hypothetical protein AAF458_05395 [Pseudomonadota bacterium]
MDFSYDPVTALDEASATGPTAELFADIRATMQIPLVTSIWRGLAGMDDSLAAVWAPTRPIYAGTDPAVELKRVVDAARLPIPAPLAPTQLACLGVTHDDLTAIRAIVGAYNRSNGMNLVTLAALLSETSNAAAASHRVSPVPAWTDFPALLPQPEIAAGTWDLVRHVNAFGAPGLDANVATLWRHLAHWPALLAIIHSGFAPLHASGAIDAATAEIVELARDAGVRMAHLRGDTSGISDAARSTITGYVRTPTQVVRMVTLGHALERWLR